MVETPEIIPLNEEVPVTLGKEFQKLRHYLELVLCTIQSKNKKLKTWKGSYSGWMNSNRYWNLFVPRNELKHQVVTVTEPRICRILMIQKKIRSNY